MAGLIKRENAPVPIAFSFDDLARRGQEIIARAEQRAAKILADSQIALRRQFEQERARGHAEGLMAGRADGAAQAKAETTKTALAEARGKITHLTAALTTAVADFDQGKRRFLAEAEGGVTRLALAIARRVCKIEAGKNNEIAAENAKNLLGLVRHEHDLELCVSPADLALMQSTVDAFIKSTNSSTHCRVVEDTTLSAGDCTLRSRSGTVDARLELQLDRIAESLTANAPAA